MRSRAAHSERNDAAPDRTLPLDALPQCAPFRFVTSATRGADESSVDGTWTIDGREAFFAGHFPTDPIVPGVLITEALAQLCGLCPRATMMAIPGSEGTAIEGSEACADRVPGAAPGAVTALLVRSEMRFRAIVRPPATITLHAKLDRTVGTLLEFDVEAELGGRRVAEGRLTLRLATQPEAV